MTTQEKRARPGEATPRRAEAGAGLGRSTTSTANNITAAESRQMQIADFLGHGQEAAVPPAPGEAGPPSRP